MTGDRWPWRSRLLVAAAAAWLGFVLLHRLVSGRWWLWLFPELMPPILFLIVPLLLLTMLPLARPARRWLALTCTAGLLIGAGLSGLNPYALRQQQGAVPLDAVRIVSWNTEGWSRFKDPDEFYRLLVAMDADVYLLQEYVPHEDPAQQRADLARLRDEFAGYHLVEVGELLTLSRYPIEATVPLPSAPPPGADWETEYQTVKALRTDLRIGQHTLSVYNLHLVIPVAQTSPLTVTYYSERRRLFQERETQVQGVEVDIAANPLPMIVSGDLNAGPAAADAREVAGDLQDAARASPSLYPVSWRADQLPLWRIDWTFTSAGVDVHRYWLRDPHGMSDHRMQELLVSPAD